MLKFPFEIERNHVILLRLFYKENLSTTKQKRKEKTVCDLYVSSFVMAGDIMKAPAVTL